MSQNNGERGLECRCRTINVDTMAFDYNLVLLDKTDINWKVHNFRQMLISETSPNPQKRFDFAFTIEENSELPKLNWLVGVVPTQQGLPEDSDEYKLRVFFCIIGGYKKLSDRKIYLQVEMEILNEDGTRWNIGQDSEPSLLWDEARPDGYASAFCISQPYDNGNTERHLEKLPFTLDGSLLIRFVFRHYVERSVILYENKMDPKTVECWLQHFESKAQSDGESVVGKDADVQIISSDGKTVHFHKELLVARSPVFDAMFRSEMQEFQSGVIKLVDISEQGVNFLHHFIYDGQMMPYLENMKSGEALGELEQWIYIASKYQLEDLVNFFDKLLPNLCNEGNAVELFKLCNRFALMGAREDVRGFIHGHAEVLNNIS